MNMLGRPMSLLLRFLLMKMSISPLPVSTIILMVSSGRSSQQTPFSIFFSIWLYLICIAEIALVKEKDINLIIKMTGFGNFLWFCWDFTFLSWFVSYVRTL
jgi:hypothetical protein